MQVKRQWDPTPELLQRLLDHKSRLYDDFDSVLLREWVVDWYHRLRPHQPPNFLKFPDQFWKLVAEDSGPSANKKMKDGFKMLSTTLSEYTYRILGFQRKSGEAAPKDDDAPPPHDVAPVKVLQADEWLPRFCQYAAFQRVRNDPVGWAGLDVWVEVCRRRVDICDKEMERRCRNYHQRIIANIQGAEDQERELDESERTLNDLINGHLLRVYKFPNYKKNRCSEWMLARDIK